MIDNPRSRRVLAQSEKYLLGWPDVRSGLRNVRLAKQREHLCGVRRLWQEESNFGRRGLRSNHAAKLLEPDVRRFVRRDREGLRQFRSQWEISGGVVHQVKWDHRTRGHRQRVAGTRS